MVRGPWLRLWQRVWWWAAISWCAIAGWHVGVPCCVPLLGDMLGCHSWVPWRDAIVESTTIGLCCGVYVGFFSASYQHALALTPAWIGVASVGPSMKSQSICVPPPVRSRKALQRRLVLRGSEASANVCLHDHWNARHALSAVRAYCDAEMYQTESWTGSLWKMIWNGGQNTHCQSLHRYKHYPCIHACIQTYINRNIHKYIALHYITLHYITLHYITLHCTTLHYIRFSFRICCSQCIDRCVGQTWYALCSTMSCLNICHVAKRMGIDS